MTDIKSKLAEGVRKARTAQPATPAAPQPAVSRPATRNELPAPAVTVYDPWRNLHPRRIWPD